MKKILSWVWLISLCFVGYSLFVLVVDTPSDRTYYESFIHVTRVFVVFCAIILAIVGWVWVTLRALEEVKKK